MLENQTTQMSQELMMNREYPSQLPYPQMPQGPGQLSMQAQNSNAAAIQQFMQQQQGQAPLQGGSTGLPMMNMGQSLNYQTMVGPQNPHGQQSQVMGVNAAFNQGKNNNNNNNNEGLMNSMTASAAGIYGNPYNRQMGTTDGLQQNSYLSSEEQQQLLFQQQQQMAAAASQAQQAAQQQQQQHPMIVTHQSTQMQRLIQQQPEMLGNNIQGYPQNSYYINQQHQQQSMNKNFGVVENGANSGNYTDQVFPQQMALGYQEGSSNENEGAQIHEVDQTKPVNPVVPNTSLPQTTSDQGNKV